MALPPDARQRISTQFAELLSNARDVLSKMERAESEARARDRASNMFFSGERQHCPEEFFSLKTRSLTLLEHLTFQNTNLQRSTAEIASLSNKISDTRKLIGYIDGLHKDFEIGMFDSLPSLIVAEVSGDYMSQAERLLGEGIAGQFDHVPAAVLAGAVLEDSLRRLCQRQNPPIPITKPNGDPKTLGTYIDDLKAAGLYNELKAKQLRAWADIRNAAAHGEFSKFNRADVETMLQGVQKFLADHL